VTYMQEEIHRAAYRFQKEVEAWERVVVGVNRFQEEEPPYRADETDYSGLEAVQSGKVERLRQERDGVRSRRPLRPWPREPGGPRTSCPGSWRR
jgi:methylmalonyl-CoA mutase, N-terminal domain